MVDRTIDFTLTDDFGNSVPFATSDELREFVTEEQERWHWMHAANRSRVDLIGNLSATYRAAIQWIDAFESGSMDGAQLRTNFAAQYKGERPKLVLSEFAPGTNVSMVRDQLGVDAGYMAFAFLTGQNNPVFHDLKDLRIWQLMANPSQIQPEVWTTELQRQLSSIQTRMKAEITRQQNTANSQAQNWDTRNVTDRLRYRSLVARAFAIGAKRSQRLSEKGKVSIEAINDVRAAFELHMHLKAPVKYWSDKSEAHATAAFNWGVGLAIYLACAILFVVAGFDNAWNALDKPALTGRHFLLVALIGAVLTLMFWIARLGVRIFLAERHLHTDAEERRVMTQAYLALMKEGQASDQERIVILSALFRTASDGIVKDDGAGDISLPAMVARLLDPKAK